MLRVKLRIVEATSLIVLGIKIKATGDSKLNKYSSIIFYIAKPLGYIFSFCLVTLSW